MKKNLFQRNTIFSILSFLFVFLLGGPPDAASFEATHTDSATGMEFIPVPGGCYEMGNKWGGGSYTEYPAHEVCVDGFYIGKTEVTQGEWTKLMESNPSYFKMGDDYPVENVSRAEISTFLQKMNQENRKGFRLPTEAEWEYACRAGTTTEYYWGNNQIDDYAWYVDNSDYSTHEVAELLKNAYGLYDLCGNVSERCK